VIPRISRLGIRALGGVLERIASGEPGEPQPTEGATEAGPFGEDYATIDWSRPARTVHDQVRAWTFAGGIGSVPGPFGELAGRRWRIGRTTLQPAAEPACRVDCGDGPLWVLEHEPAD
jgi:methionyl-tRNA formyltransferase